jgi:hypothetical protein
MRLEGLGQMKKSNDVIGNRNRDCNIHDAGGRQQFPANAVVLTVSKFAAT